MQNSWFVRWYSLLIALAILIVALFSWLSSGTLSPYATTSPFVRTLAPCNYLINEDHSDFKGVFLLLDGADRKSWEGSCCLRRILHPLVGYPFMKIWGFELGGLIFNILLHCGVTWLAAGFFRRRWGPESAVLFAWIFATYPGIYYWVGLPYPYAAIVPVSVMAFLLIWKLYEKSDLKTIAWISSSLGLLFLAYDLFPIFGGAALLMTAFKTRKWHTCLLALVLLLIPNAVMAFIISHGLKVSLVNSNTAAYGHILGSYFHKPDWEAWRPYLLDAPYLLKENFGSSGFHYLPTAFLVSLVLNRIWKPIPFSAVAWCISIAVMGTWCFNNLAPPYPGFQLRGTYVPRLYQPFFVVMIFFLAHKGQQMIREQKRIPLVVGGILLLYTVLGNTAISLGSVRKSGEAADRYLRFYKHSPRIQMIENLDKFGVRPWGFCQP